MPGAEDGEYGFCSEPLHLAAKQREQFRDFRYERKDVCSTVWYQAYGVEINSTCVFTACYQGAGGSKITGFLLVIMLLNHKREASAAVIKAAGTACFLFTSAGKGKIATGFLHRECSLNGWDDWMLLMTKKKKVFIVTSAVMWKKECSPFYRYNLRWTTQQNTPSLII